MPQPGIGVIGMVTSGEYLFIAPLAASTPRPITPPKMRLPAAIPSKFEERMAVPSLKHSLVHRTATLSLPFGRVTVAGVSTVMVPTAEETRVHVAP